jgi:transposase
VARALKSSRQSVSRWYQQRKQGGVPALRGAGRAGRKPKLNAAQRRQVERALRQGARAHGFGTDLWTLPRVAAVIERVTGVRYHPGHVWRIMGKRLVNRLTMRVSAGARPGSKKKPDPISA